MIKQKCNCLRLKVITLSKISASNKVENLPYKLNFFIIVCNEPIGMAVINFAVRENIFPH